MRPAILKGAMAIPIESVELPRLKKQLTYSYLPMGEEEALEVEAYWVDGDFVHVPRQYGLELCNRLHLSWEDHTSFGSAISPPKVPEPRDYQAEVLSSIVNKFDHFFDFLFRAHTGWGKTIGSLIAAARLGRTTLIVVDQENLKDQWIAALNKLFGYALEDIGIVQGKKATYRGKDFTIAMVQTLCQKEYPDDFYEYFGTVLLDEVHVIGAPTFSTILPLFSAAYRLGISATPKRKDGLQKALDHHLGKVRVAADKEHDRSAVYILRHDTVYSWYANISPKVGRIINEVSEDGRRNLMVAEAAMRLYQSGRDVLILSDRIEHLKHLQSLLFYLGVEEEETGLYAGYDPVWVFGKDPSPAKRPAGLEPDAEYCAVHFSTVNKRIPKKRLDHVKEHSPIILATYGMFSKGTDVPRLSAGIDATPRSAAEQIHGRILREEEGKPMPIWATVIDDNNYRLVYASIGRLREYEKSNVGFYEWKLEGGVSPCDANALRSDAAERVKSLKSHQIVTLPDGRNMLVTPQSVKRQKRRQESDIVKRIRAVKARSGR